jgi:hypothetical protein
MNVCFQCHGSGYTILDKLSIETYKGSNVFTAPTQNTPAQCNVTVQGANQMMRSQQNSGVAESGRGVTLSGFYAPNGDVQARLGEINSAISDIALHEAEGWTVFIGVAQPVIDKRLPKPRLAIFRREAHKFFEDLPAWFFRTKAVQINRLCLSQASGFISLTLLYCEESGV